MQSNPGSRGGWGRRHDRGGRSIARWGKGRSVWEGRRQSRPVKGDPGEGRGASPGRCPVAAAAPTPSFLFLLFDFVFHPSHADGATHRRLSPSCVPTPPPSPLALLQRRPWVYHCPPRWWCGVAPLPLPQATRPGGAGGSLQALEYKYSCRPQTRPPSRARGGGVRGMGHDMPRRVPTGVGDSGLSSSASTPYRRAAQARRGGRPNGWPTC